MVGRMGLGTQTLEALNMGSALCVASEPQFLQTVSQGWYY